MSNHNYHYRDDNFSLDKAATYTLLLQVKASSFSYAIVDQGRLMAWHENCEIAELLDPHQLDYILTSSYKEIIIGLPDKGFSLIPTALYQAEQLIKFASLLDVKENEKVFSEPLDKLNHIIYKVDQNIVNAVAAIFNLNDVVFSRKGWITAIANTAPVGQNLYLHIKDEAVDILYIAKGRLRFYNHFEFKNADELVYYTMLAANELQLEPGKIILVLSGEVNSGDAITTRLGQFFAGLIFNKIQILSLPEQLLSYKTMALAALSLCGSSEAH